MDYCVIPWASWRVPARQRHRAEGKAAEDGALQLKPSKQKERALQQKPRRLKNGDLQLKQMQQKRLALQQKPRRQKNCDLQLKLGSRRRAPCGRSQGGWRKATCSRSPGSRIGASCSRSQAAEEVRLAAEAKAALAASPRRFIAGSAV